MHLASQLLVCPAAHPQAPRPDPGDLGVTVDLTLIVQMRSVTGFATTPDSASTSSPGDAMIER